jgi:hypothetical protein
MLEAKTKMLPSLASKSHPRNLLDHYIRNGLIKIKYKLVYQIGFPKQRVEGMLVSFEEFCQKCKLLGGT